MADQKNNPDEPSIEEILSSIREIISDDDDEQEDDVIEQAVEKKPEPVVEDANDDGDDDDDVLDLSAFAEEDATEIAGETVVEQAEVTDEKPRYTAIDEIDMVDADEEEDSIASILSDDNDYNDEDAGQEDDKDHLIDKVAEGATVSAMAKLAENISLSRKTSGVTLEDIVRDMLRPMLKDWLDDNLPDIIERLVSQELERLAQKAARK